MSLTATTAQPPPPSHESPSTATMPPTNATNNTSQTTTVAPSMIAYLNQRTQAPMTISEMRNLHGAALAEAEAKRTELRLVLSSRYRELVGSSDEVQKMKDLSQELFDVVQNLPRLMEALGKSVRDVGEGGVTKVKEEADGGVLKVRNDLAMLPRIIHRALDENDPETASVALVRLFGLIKAQTDAYPLANLLGEDVKERTKSDDILLHAQMRMIYFHVETLPARTTKLARKVLVQKARNLKSHGSRGALCALALLDTLKEQSSNSNLSSRLLDLYYDSKAKLVHSLMSQLTKSAKKDDNSSLAASRAESIMSKIVEVLQYDVILHSYALFIVETDVPTLPEWDFDPHAAKSKCSHFLAAHIPLIRNRIRSILVNISVTPSLLGDIRQSLYDKTSVISDPHWDTALSSLVDQRIVSPASVQNMLPSSSLVSTLDQPTAAQPASFSLWSALFSNTFSTLVHSLLSTSFHSVHLNTMSTLRQSLSRAPRHSHLRPHEAQRNTTIIALQLDSQLRTLSFDAHKLLVHAEEREESEARLKQSLYVQTCEIMGRLLSELRRMLLDKEKDGEDSNNTGRSTKEFIVGRLAFLLQFKLTSLKILLDPKCAPNLGGGGMITMRELQSAFEIEDMDDDGLLTFEEAMEAMSGAFSGTSFNGAEMVRSTLLLGSRVDEDVNTNTKTNQQNVTLAELGLLSAKGLKHSVSGEQSALGIIQSCFDSIITTCFTTWARLQLASAEKTLYDNLLCFWEDGTKNNDKQFILQYPTLATNNDNDGIINSYTNKYTVSPPLLAYFLSVSTVMNNAVCPADTLTTSQNSNNNDASSSSSSSAPHLVSLVRNALLSQALASLTTVLETIINVPPPSSDIKVCQPCLVQCLIDVGFVERCFFERNQNSHFTGDDSSRDVLKTLQQQIQDRIDDCDILPIRNVQDTFMQSCDLFLSSLFGETTGLPSSSSTSAMDDQLLSVHSSSSTSTPLLIHPLPSARRFILLPIQADRQLEKLQLKASGYGKKDDDGMDKDVERASVGFGFFSSMLGAST